MNNFIKIFVLLAFFNWVGIVSGSDIDSTDKAELFSVMYRVNLDPFDFDSLMNMRQNGPGFLDRGLKYLENEDLDPNDAMTILHFAINVDRFYLIGEEKASLVRNDSEIN